MSVDSISIAIDPAEAAGNAFEPDVPSPLAGTPSPVHVQHRREWWDFVLREAEPWHRDHLALLFSLWEHWNREHLDGKMVPPYILLAEPVAPNVYGDTTSVSGFGGRSQIRLRPSLLTGTHPHVRAGSQYAEGRARFVADVLRHEMIHQWQIEITGNRETGYHGHGPGFRDRANEIGAALGLAPVRDSKRRGADADLPSCSGWPHNVRPIDHYLGAYTPPDGLSPAGLMLREASEFAKYTCTATGVLRLCNAALTYDVTTPAGRRDAAAWENLGRDQRPPLTLADLMKAVSASGDTT